MDMLKSEDDPNMMFEFANGLGAGQLIRSGKGSLAACAQAYGTTRKAWLKRLTELAVEGKRLERMYWEYISPAKDLEDLRKTGIIGSDSTEEGIDTILSSEENYNPNEPCFAKKTTASKRKPTKTPRSKQKKSKVGGMTVEQHRRRLGDMIKNNIQVEKWAIQARTHVVIPNVDRQIFEEIVMPHATTITPENDQGPVIVVTLAGSSTIGEVFGKSKIKGGTRIGSWSANKMDIIYIPETGDMRCWWTMLES